MQANPERAKARASQWVLENKDRHKEAGRKWLAANRAHVNKLARISRAANPDAERERSTRGVHRRKTLKAGSLGTLSKREWNAIVAKQRGRCAYWNRTDLPWVCPSGKTKPSLHRDHCDTPLSKGGCSFAFNYQGLCASCNSRKHATIMSPVVSLFDKI